MRWKKEPCPQYGDIKKIRKFLWFPECLHGEWIWLETLTCVYEYRQVIIPYSVYYKRDYIDKWVLKDWYKS